MAMTILVVDDSVTMLMSLKTSLAMNGFQVETANHGQAALDKLKSGIKPNLILTDINMPCLLYTSLRPPTPSCSTPSTIPSPWPTSISAASPCAIGSSRPHPAPQAMTLSSISPARPSPSIPQSCLLYTSTKDSATGNEKPNPTADYIGVPNALQLAEAYGGKIQWDAEDHSAYFYFYRDQMREWIFFTDLRTFKDRYELVQKNGIQGFCSWVLGEEDPAIWTYLPHRH